MSWAGVLGAGAAGLVSLEAVAPIERRLLGARPVFAADRIARGLRRRWHIAGSSASLAPWLQGSYGLALAAILRAIPRRPASPLWRGLVDGTLIWAAELLALPATGATPPVRRWRRGEVALLLAHATAFALTVALVSERRSSDG